MELSAICFDLFAFQNISRKKSVLNLYSDKLIFEEK